MFLLCSASKTDNNHLNIDAKILRESNMSLKYKYIIFEHAKASHKILTKFNNTKEELCCN